MIRMTARWWIGWWVLLSLWPGLALASESLGERLTQAEQRVNSEPRVALRIAEDVLAAAESVGDRPTQAEALRLLGVARNITGSNETALQALQRALALFEAEGNRARQTLVLRHLGVVHFDAGRSDQALDHYLRALAGFEAAGEPIEVAKTRANIANVFQRTGRAAEAVAQHRAALQTFEQAGAALPIAGTHLNLGSALRALAESEGNDDATRRRALYLEAQQSFMAAARIFRGLDVARGVLKAEANLAATLASLGDDAAASRSLREVLGVAREVGDVQEEILALKRLLSVEHRLGRLASALAAAAEGLSLAVKLEDRDAQESFHRSLSELHEASGDTATALVHARQAETLAKQRVQSEQALRVAEISRRYENAQRDRELEALKQAAALDQAELARQRILRNAAIVIGTLALGILLLYASRHRLREQARQELERAAQSDPLTSLLNRRGLRQRVGAGLPEVYAVVLADIDNFKRINDQHGHDVGDLVLVETARRIAAAVRPDDQAARWGGEEFLVLLPLADSAAAMQIGERLRLAVAASPIGDPATGLSVTLSLGVAVRLPGQHFDAVVQAADHALLDAKRSGKDRVVYAAPRLRGLPAVAAGQG